MNRTTLLLVSAAVLCALALTAGRSSPQAAPSQPPPPPVIVVAPPPSPAAPVAPLAAPAPAPAPSSGPLTLTASLSSGKVLSGESTVYARLDLAARAAEGRIKRLPVNLALAIDHSGSMSNGKLDQAKQAAIAMIDQLRTGDRLAIVAFDDSVSTFPSTPITARSKSELREFVQHIYENGGTNISGALEAAYAQLRPWTGDYRVSRVVLLSDGQPGSGITDPQALARLAERSRAARISTSAFGIGLDYNAALMSGLANGGGGGYRFIENAANLGLAFSHELGDASQLLARDVRVRLEVPAGVTVDDVPGHVFSRAGGAVDVPLYDFGPGQTAQLLVRLRVNAPSRGDVLLVMPKVHFVDVQRDAPATLEQPLTATVVYDAAQVAAAADAKVKEMETRVELATRVQEAQRVYESGDTTKALDLMASVRRLFGSSADALAGDESVLEASWRKGGDDARRVNLGLTNKTMQNFGQNNTY